MQKKYLNLIVIFLLIVICMPTVAYGLPSADEVSQQIADTNKEIEKINAQIKIYQDQIDKTHQTGTTLKSAIAELTLTRNKLLKQVEQTSKKIQATGTVIKSLDNTITEKEKEIVLLREALKASIYRMYQAGDKTFAEFIISNDNLTLTDEIIARASINSSTRSLSDDLSNVKTNLEKNLTQKQIEKENLTKLKNKLDLDKKSVEVVKKEKDTLLKDTQNKESEYQKLLLEQQKKRDAFEKELSDYEAQLKFILNTKLLPTAGSGVLSWPLDYVLITQLFGKTSASKRLYVSGSHSGVDFRAPVGTEVKSMGSGTVIGVGDTDLYCKGASFGKWVYIDYNNGLSSTFGHLSAISAKAGDKVKTGDVVGLSGNTGHSTGPHLHVTVYASQGAGVKTLPSLSCSGKTFIMPVAPVNAYLDPLLYLPKTTAKMFKSGSGLD